MSRKTVLIVVGLSAFLMIGRIIGWVVASKAPAPGTDPATATATVGGPPPAARRLPSAPQ